jgi:PAS domain S-box-containing protein
MNSSHQELENRIKDLELELARLKSGNNSYSIPKVDPTFQSDALSKLKQFSIELSDLSNDEVIEEWIINQLKEISGAEVAIFSEYNPSNKTSTPKHILMEQGLLDKVVKLLGSQIQKIQSIVSDEMYKEMTNDIIGNKKTLHEASFGAIPKPVSAEIQKLLKVDRFIGIAYLIEGKIYGTSILGMKKNVPDPPRQVLENFVSLAAASLRRKQAELALLNNKARLNKTQEIAHLGSWELDLQTQQLIWSDEVYRIFGLQPQEFAATHDAFMETVHPDDRDALSSAYFSSVNENKTGYEIEHRIVRKNTGEIRHVYEKCEHLRDASGNIIKSTGMVQDITERKVAELALKESQHKFIALTENLPGYIAYVNAKTLKYEYVNKQYQKSFGLPIEKIIGSHVREIIGEENFQFALKYIEQVREGKPASYENVFNMLNGKRWIKVHYTPHFDTNGNVASIVVLTYDITERKQAEIALIESEKKFHELFEFNTDGITIFLINPDGLPSKILDLNQNAATMLGYSKEEVLQMSPNDFETNTTKEQIEKRIFELKSKGFSDFETFIKHKDGYAINVEVKVIVINYNNQPALMNITRDINKRKHAEQLLLESEEKYKTIAGELRSLNSDKDRFITILAHDLKSPFNALLGLSELLSKNIRKYSIDKAENLANHINKTAENSYNLLDNLLLWVRSQSGKLPYQPEKFAFTEICDSTIEMIKPHAIEKNINIKFFAAEEITVFGDVEMFKTIIRNLISNAIKFTNLGGRINVYAEQNTSEVTITISDNGIGIDTEAAKNLFDFSQYHSTKGTANEKGTGLGLFICKDFIEKHGGKIWVESILNHGSDFKFTIPKKN